MKNTLIAILVLIILVLGYLFIKEKTSYRSTINEWPETVPAIPTNNNQTSTNNNNPAPQTSHEYSNTEYGFYVDIPGRTVTLRDMVGRGGKRFLFEKPNQGENSLKDFSVTVMTSEDWQQQWDSYASTAYQNEGTVTYNGIVFNHYTTPAVDPGIDEPQTLHFYVTQQDGLYYQVYTTNPSYLSSFGFL